MLTAVVMVILFTFGENARIGSSQDGEDELISSKLRTISISRERIEVEYYTLTGGIHVLSKVSSSDAVQVLVTTASEELLFAVDRTSSSGLVSIVGNEFLLLNETANNGKNRLTEYLVPPNYSQKVKSALKHNRLPKVLRYLNTESVNTTANGAVEELLSRPEVLLIKDAAFALGNTGVIGADNPAAMAFYTTALRFTKALAEEENVASGELEDIGIPERRRSKRGLFCGWWFRPSCPERQNCPNSNSRCVNCPTGPQCLGLCGPGCNCWRFICRDCCYNRGCYWHDVHGCSGGRNSLLCLFTAPVGFVCTLGY